LVLRLCCAWFTGASNVAGFKEEPRHVRRQGTPPLIIPQPLPPQQLWPQLPTTKQQAVVRLLSELIQRQLQQPAGKEVANDPR
jgi:hypothetical protein